MAGSEVKLLSPARRSACVDHVIDEKVSERRARRVPGQHPSTQRNIAKTPDDEAALTADITALALRYGRYCSRRITAMLHQAGWIVNLKQVERFWRREGLRVPQKPPKRRRLWSNDKSCIRLRPAYPSHVWSYDFIEDRAHNGRNIRVLNVIGGLTRECIAIKVERKLKAVDVIDVPFRPLHPEGHPDAHSFRQRPVFHRQGTPEVDRMLGIP